MSAKPLFSQETWKELISLLEKFLNFLNKEKNRSLNFSLLSLFFFLLPINNFYASLNLPIKKPVISPSKLESFPLSFYPVNVTGEPPGWLSAKAVLVMDLDSRALLYVKNPDLSLMPASTTKIMTALVVLERDRLNKTINVGKVYTVGQVMKLQPQEEITIKDLLYGLLVQSGNDAAMALASDYPGGVEAFVKKMNEKAKEIYLKNTTFTNPIGIEEYGHYSTAHDLTLLAAFALKNQEFQSIVATKEITVFDKSGKIKHVLNNVNQLLGEVEGIKGVKTGWTENAGECLIAEVERNNHQIITVVLGSQDRFQETKTLIEWVFANHKWQPIPATQEKPPEQRLGN